MSSMAIDSSSLKLLVLDGVGYVVADMKAILLLHCFELKEGIVRSLFY